MSSNVAIAAVTSSRDAPSFSLLERLPEAKRALGKNHELTFRMQRMYAQCLFRPDDASLDDVTAAVAMLEDLERRIARTLGNGHPQTQGTQYFLKMARAKLDATRACA